MENMNSILKFLENRCILVTGATGFLAKVFIEKILRVQPNVKKLYLLVRAVDHGSALHRFKTEVIGKELFGVVKEKYGPSFESFIHEKTSVIAGDIAVDHCLGVKGSSTLEELYDRVEIVVNLAATTDFDERLDVSIGINTIGAANVLSFSKKCNKLKLLLHVSTAYVCGEKEGLILEKSFKFGETLNIGTPNFDIDNEILYADDTLQQLQAHKQASQTQITSSMKDLGIQRARKYGWPNTYSFTKAMGEMLLGRLKGNVPLVIVRPTIITSTYKEPFPGWLEGVRNIDSFIVGYGKGRMSYLPGDPLSIIDLIPADMVVNAMIVSMAAHADDPTDEVIYHVGSSMLNPVLYRSLQDYGFRYFTERPWMDKDGKRVVVRKATELGTKDIVRRHIQLHYLIPLKVLSVVNTASCQYFQGMYLDLARKVMFLTKLVELFSPYIFFKGVFDDMNTEKLRRAAMERCGAEEMEIFCFDPKRIKWDDYFMYIHIAGVVKYGFMRPK